jgi:hypothetical protein
MSAVNISLDTYVSNILRCHNSLCNFCRIFQNLSHAVLCIFPKVKKIQTVLLPTVKAKGGEQVGQGQHRDQRGQVEGTYKLKEGNRTRSAQRSGRTSRGNIQVEGTYKLKEGNRQDKVSTEIREDKLREHTS